MADRTSQSNVRTLLLIFTFCISAAAGFYLLSLEELESAQTYLNKEESGTSPLLSCFLPDGSRDGLVLSGICFQADELFISYRESNLVDVYNHNLRFLRRLSLNAAPSVSITSIDAGAGMLFLTDFGGKEILFADPSSGELKYSFGFLPDRTGRIDPFSVSYYGDMLYISDVTLQSVIVVAASDYPSLRELGEVVLRIPAIGSNNSLRFPTFTSVTPDGRLLISDLAAGNVGMFSCSGRFIQTFAPPSGEMAPMGVVQDNVPSPDLQARKDTIFDPSGVLGQGRLHVADAKSTCIRVFDPYGKYLGSYGDTLVSPGALAIDIKRGRIFVSDPGLNRIAVFDYRVLDFHNEKKITPAVNTISVPQPNAAVEPERTVVPDDLYQVPPRWLSIQAGVVR